MSKFFEVDFRTGSPADKTGMRTYTIPNGIPKMYNNDNGKAIYLPSSGHRYVYSSTLLPPNEFTFVVFFKCLKADVGGVMRAYTISDGGADACSFMVKNGTGRIEIRLGSNNNISPIHTVDTKWHCFICTIDGISQTATGRVFLDNKELSYNRSTVSVQQNRSLFTQIGTITGSATEGAYISYVATYDHILSEQERNDIYTDFLRSYPTHKKQRQIEYTKPNDLSREKDIVVSNNLLLPGTTTNYYANDIAAWSLYGSNTKTQEGNAVKITYVDSALGAFCMFRASNNVVASDPLIGVKYKIRYRYKVTGTLDIRVYNGAAFVTLAGQTNTDWIEREDEFFCAVANNCYMAFLNMSAGEAVWIEFLEFKSYQGLVAAYNFKPIRNVLVDISGNGYNFTNYRVASTTRGIDYTKGRLAYSQMSSALNLGTTYSVLMRIIPKSIGSAILGNESSSTNYFNFASTTQLQYRTSTGALNQNITAIITGKEITLAFTRNNTTSLISYVDMVLYNGTLSDNSTFSFRNISKLFSSYGDIEMIDLRIYNYAISEQQIKDYHNQFAKEVYIQEDFTNNGADGISKVPYSWYKGSGVYKIGEIPFANVGYTQGYIDYESGLVGSLTAGVGQSATYTLNTTNPISGTQDALIDITVQGSTGNRPFIPGLFNNNMKIGGRYRFSFDYKMLQGTNQLYAIYTGSSTYNVFIDMIGEGFISVDFTATGQSSGVFPYFINNISKFQIDNLKCIEISHELPTIVGGTKYLECVTSGTIALPSKQAYGTWEFDLYKGADASEISCYYINNNDKLSPSVGYRTSFSNTERVTLQRAVNGSSVVDNFTISSYIQNNTWYRIKITRTLSGVITLYIKGGTFGNEYVLVSMIGGLGTNPITDNTYTTSNFFTIVLDVGSRIANIIMRKGIEV